MHFKNEDRCGDCGNTIEHCNCDGGLQPGEPDQHFYDMID
jgi:hypothetical protein